MTGKDRKADNESVKAAYTISAKDMKFHFAAAAALGGLRTVLAVADDPDDPQSFAVAKDLSCWGASAFLVIGIVLAGCAYGLRRKIEKSGASPDDGPKPK